MITTSLQLDGGCLREWQIEGIDGWTCLELPVGGEVVQVHLRRPPVRGLVVLDEEARELSLDEAAEVCMLLGLRVMAGAESKKGKMISVMSTPAWKAFVEEDSKKGKRP